MKPKHYNIPIFLPELSCPHRCVFCNQQKISGTQKVPSAGQVKSIIDKHLTTIKSYKNTNIAFFGGSFTGLPLEMQKEYLSVARPYITQKKVSGIRLSTRPDYIDRENLAVLREYGVQTIELGAQSFDKDVLKLSQRGHNIDDTERAARLIKSMGFELGLQMMIGLPGDNPTKAMHTAQEIVRLEADSTRIYPTLVIKDTALARFYKEKKYDPMSIPEAVKLTKELSIYFEKHNVTILRVGLHPSEDLNYNKSLLAGPYHPSFNELVLTERWNDILQNAFVDKQPGNYRLSVNPKQLNYAVGYKSKNSNTLAKQGFSLSFIPDSSVRNFKLKFD
ncbi:MAG: radical SAM protein [Bacteroidota bacterium]|nr:radical SAM protein [Bacteroidota bacterium]